MEWNYLLSAQRLVLFQGCQEDHDPFVKDYPPWTAFRSDDYGYTRMTIYNNTHLYMDQVSVDLVRETTSLRFNLLLCSHLKLKRMAIPMLFGQHQVMEINVIEWEWCVIQLWHRQTRKKNFRVLLSGVEPENFRILVRMLCHWATGDSWELRPLN